jgi:hypothetical protein
MRAEIMDVELKSRRDVDFVEDWHGKRHARVGGWEYTAELKLSCDSEFLEALWKWCAERGVTGARAYLPEGVVPLPPADSTPLLSPAIKPGTKALPPAVVDGEFEDGDFETE